jgi:hypothetical protein
MGDPGADAGRKGGERGRAEINGLRAKARDARGWRGADSREWKKVRTSFCLHFILFSSRDTVKQNNNWKTRLVRKVI